MRFARFGVTLERLEREHVETVRRWRNGPWVRPFMRQRAFVEKKDQIRWFEALDPLSDWYFLARTEGRPFALLHAKTVDWKEMSGEAGGFVGAPQLLGGPEAGRATLALMDFAFRVLGLHSLEAQYRSDLERIVAFNSQLGYEVFRHEEDGFLRARVSAERHYGHAALVRETAARLYGNEAVLSDAGHWLARHFGQTRGDLGVTASGDWRFEPD